MLYSDKKGRMYDYPGISAAGRTGRHFTDLAEEEMIPLPEGAALVSIPGGIPVGINKAGSFNPITAGLRGEPAFAVGALLPQGYTRTLLPAFRRWENKPLPLFGYAAVGWKEGRVYVAALQTDEDDKWNPVHYSTPELKDLVDKASQQFGDNPIIGQLGNCALNYRCFTAQNIFYRRWEGGIPVSPACNAGCLGCISLQPAECCPSPQNRISFIPTARQIAEVAVPHLAGAEDAIISFGQGCEGEPSLADRQVAEAILLIRRETESGTVNMNTNAGFTKGIANICRAGIDALRVSTVSARDDIYTAYYSPQGYRWADVCASVALARGEGVFVSLNLLTFPGLTDLPEQVEDLVEFIRKYDVNMVQIRNLNIDPDFLADRLPLPDKEPLGINSLLEVLSQELPGAVIGNYSRPVSR